MKLKYHWSSRCRIAKPVGELRFWKIHVGIENKITSSRYFYFLWKYMLYFVHTYFLVGKKNSKDSLGRTSIVLLKSAFSSRSVPPATDGQYEDRLRIASLGSTKLEARAAWLLEFSWRRQPKRKTRRRSSITGGNSFVSFCPPTQRRATITVVAHCGLGPGNHRFL